ncbi:MAG: hypothetical protein J7K87_01530 [Candidatus Aenigmarchaeota archaeon]|nr:hypothetical protein [Candidatus Aenigmarchaeota archaeon]
MNDVKTIFVLFLMVVSVIFVSGCTSGNNGNIGSMDVSGAWHGTYTSSQGNGEWSWIIERKGNEYTGMLTTTGPYAGANVPISVTINGNKITVGWVAAGVVFEGTISGNKMLGTWKFQNLADKGSWSGEKGETSITPKSTTESTTETTQVETQENENPYNSANNIQPLGEDERHLDEIVRPMLLSVFSGVKLTSTASVTSGGSSSALGYIVNRVVTSSDISSLRSSITSRGYKIILDNIESDGTFALGFMENGNPMFISGKTGEQWINAGSRLQ